jgi:hypothetical protein
MHRRRPQSWWRCAEFDCIYEKAPHQQSALSQPPNCPNCNTSLLRVWPRQQPMNWYQYYMHFAKNKYIVPLEMDLANRKEQVAKDAAHACLDERVEWLYEAGRTDIDPDTMRTRDWKALRGLMLVAPTVEKIAAKRMQIRRDAESIARQPELRDLWTRKALEAFETSSRRWGYVPNNFG